MNKGLKLRLCKECKRKRFCKRERVPGNNLKYTCSKGHTWTLVGLTMERINLIMQDIISETIPENLFDRDNFFFRSLRNK